jgi:hypothetical protein
MRRLFALPFLAACLPAPALAEVPLPDSCQPRIAGVALAVADEAGEAQLTCDIDRAAIFQGRANAIFGPVSNPLGAGRRSCRFAERCCLCVCRQ